MNHRHLSILALLALLLAATGCSGSGSGNRDENADEPSNGQDDGPSPMFADIEVVRYPMGSVSPANADSPYAGVLGDCTFSNTRTEPCTLATLPLLGQEHDDPGIEDVMDRVIVSHAWMGSRFREILEAMPDDLLLLMRGVTAVIISADVRPSFYWTATGAIYLDSDFVWLTPAERADTPDFPDFRQDFGDELQFVMPWRYVKDNRPAMTSTPQGQSRTLDDILINIARLLYHELAHANDFFPPERQADLGGGRPQQELRTPFISDDLVDRHPLASETMRGLARVRFHGNSPNDAQRAITPEEVVDEFAPDQAIVFYSYSTLREDLAMLFEILMMRFHFGAEMDHAVTNNPENPTSANDFIVAWGQRNRLGDVNVKERARFAASRLLPEMMTELDPYIDALPEPRMMRQGEGWGSNIVLDPDAEPQLSHHDGGIMRRYDDEPVRDLHGYH